IQPRAYVEEHIPGAILFNIDAAFYPSKYIRFDLYPPEVFERYMRLLGVNNDDHVIVYGRGPFAGMMWPAKAWWALKVYGHGKVSVLDGGLDAWKKAGYPVTNQVVQRRPGNFTAKPLDDSYLVTFEELDKKNRNGKSLFDELNTVVGRICLSLKISRSFPKRSFLIPNEGSKYYILSRTVLENVLCLCPFSEKAYPSGSFLKKSGYGQRYLAHTISKVL
ncbi:unnamed protein product, partial [Haemonchus placei]|uniref:Rhodanese domain-containing protein n=1 Tax=Haemonchus placei TaxID=6290 RepID=A0A0N4WNT5_HAEPC